MDLEFKGTPGKWIQSHRMIPNDEEGMYSTQIYTEDGETIATLSWYPNYEIKGQITTYRDENAKLIAASPDLLEALKDLVRYCEENNVGAELELSHSAIEKALK